MFDVQNSSEIFTSIHRLLDSEFNENIHRSFLEGKKIRYLEKTLFNDATTSFTGNSLRSIYFLSTITINLLRNEDHRSRGEGEPAESLEEISMKDLVAYRSSLHDLSNKELEDRSFIVFFQKLCNLQEQKISLEAVAKLIPKVSGIFDAIRENEPLIPIKVCNAKIKTEIHQLNRKLHELLEEKKRRTSFRK